MKCKKILSDLGQTARLSKQFGFGFAIRSLVYRYGHKTMKYINNVKSVLLPFVNCNPTECKVSEMPDIVPVWILWWQGESEMPEIVKVCYSSLKSNLPDKTKPILLTRENYQNYAEIPEEIIDKVDRGIYSITLFSDLLRNELLSRHGGFWVDATIYCAKPIDYEFLMNRNFWSIKLYPDENDRFSIGRNITNRMWGGFIQKSAPGERLNIAVFEALKKYMIECNVLVEYFLQNIFIRILYESDPLIKSEIDEIPYSNPNLYELAKIMNEPYVDDEWDRLISDTTFFKLSWKKNYAATDSEARETYFGHLIKTSNQAFGEGAQKDDK